MGLIDRGSSPTPARGLVPAGIALLALLAAVCGCAEDRSQRTPTPQNFRDTVRQHLETDAWWQGDLEEPDGERAGTLSFDRVHEEIRGTEAGHYVVCVDFHAADGTVYDVDFYMASEINFDEEVVVHFVDDVVVHKVGGEDVLSERRRELDRRG